MVFKTADLKPSCRLGREIDARRSGFTLVIGTDEAGRGPLAGPVVAGAVAVLDPLARDPVFREILANVDDSKKLTPDSRAELFAKLTAHPAIAWGVAAVPPTVIDRVNILQASRLAMKRAIRDLGRRTRIEISAERTFCLIDGNTPIEIDCRQETVIGGDRTIFSISAASIIAKVTRDRVMEKMDKSYPGYGFARHKGYGTAAHLEALMRLGPCRIHRRSFSPVRASIEITLAQKNG